MKAFVITMMDLPQSVECAERCIESGKKVGLKVEMFKATTPKDDPFALFEREGLPDVFFKEITSRQVNCMSAFFSHYSLWKKCIQLNQDVVIFEHDAVLVDKVPEFMNFQGCISLGAPSYGAWKVPYKLGVVPLTSKNYFPGAHAYRVNPQGARALVAKALESAAPTDLFLSYQSFSWLEEYYPFPAVCKDTFTTIQNEGGCVNKHSKRKLGDEYEIIRHD